MNIKALTYFLSGIFSSLIITYIFIIRKFNRFINNEIDHNEAYRLNAEDHYNSINNKFDEADEESDFTHSTETGNLNE